MEVRKIKGALSASNDFTEKFYKSIHYFPEILDYLDILVILDENYSDGAAYTRLIEAKIAAVAFNFIKKVDYYTIGHELSHILQAMKIGEKGEATCDMITFSRSHLFVSYDSCYLSFGISKEQIRSVSKERIYEIAKSAVVYKGMKKFSLFREMIRNEVK